MLLVILAAAAAGCGRRDLGFVRGQVVSNGGPRGFTLPEMMNVTFSMDDAKIPRAYTTPVRADGSFQVDMNDGSGRGIPNGAYVVAIDTNNLLMRPAGGGAAAVARVLNQTGGDLGKEIMEQLGERDADVAAGVKALMFVFEDLLQVDGKGVQRLLREVESRELAIALKAASDELKAHIRANMSERAAGALEEEMEMLGPVRVKDVQAAQARIIDSVRALEESGEIMIAGRGGSDDVIV